MTKKEEKKLDDILHIWFSALPHTPSDINRLFAQHTAIKSVLDVLGIELKEQYQRRMNEIKELKFKEGT